MLTNKLSIQGLLLIFVNKSYSYEPRSKYF
jgi:hypothetical protein